MASIHQKNINRFHTSHSHAHSHGELDVFVAHRRWHADNVPPKPPTKPDRNWGTNDSYGEDFLKMHRQMLEGVRAWYLKERLELPASWDPKAAIPDELGYEPDKSVFPQSVLNNLEQIAKSMSTNVDALLTRVTDSPNYSLPRWFTKEGIGLGEQGELFTGARKLEDFVNINQLGNCLDWPHAEWHRRIGGAMARWETSPADPIFYFGVHLHIDKVYSEFEAIEVDRIREPVLGSVFRSHRSREFADDVLPVEFTEEQKLWIREGLEQRGILRGVPTHN